MNKKEIYLKILFAVIQSIIGDISSEGNGLTRAVRLIKTASHKNVSPTPENPR